MKLVVRVCCKIFEIGCLIPDSVVRRAGRKQIGAVQRKRPVPSSFAAFVPVLLSPWFILISAITEPSFDVASVKRVAPNPAGAVVRPMMRGGPGTSDPGLI